ncbi:hypothetical protein [Bifidobacterium sp. ESL0820]|uniref:hypothetical protein n=1 Tax=Bifidobacterium sp. ESL0820 TaxID=3448586 RepID=UPI004042CCB4
MTSILMYSVRPDEQEAIQAWAQANDIQVDTTDHDLGMKTVDMIKGYDGIVIQQHAALPEPELYQRLKDYGLKQLTLRITGYDIVNLQAARENGLVVTNVPAYSPRSVSNWSWPRSCVWFGIWGRPALAKPRMTIPGLGFRPTRSTT